MWKTHCALIFKQLIIKTEYEVLITKLSLAKVMGVKSPTTKSDSQLIVDQVNETYETKVSYLNKYLEKVKENFDPFELERILWLENNHVDALAKLKSMKD